MKQFLADSSAHYRFCVDVTCAYFKSRAHTPPSHSSPDHSFRWVRESAPAPKEAHLADGVRAGKAGTRPGRRVAVVGAVGAVRVGERAARAAHLPHGRTRAGAAKRAPARPLAEVKAVEAGPRARVGHGVSRVGSAACGQVGARGAAFRPDASKGADGAGCAAGRGARAL
jgi:hypothetical protein